MTNNEPPAPATVSVSFIDNPHAPDIYADEVVGFFITRSNVKITLAAARVNHTTAPGPINRVVIGRLVMSLDAAQELAVGLFDFLKARGVPPPSLLGEQPSQPH